MPALKKDIVTETTDNIIGEILKFQSIKNWNNYHLADLVPVKCDRRQKLYRFKKNPKKIDLEYLILVLDKLGLKIVITEKSAKIQK